MILRRRILLQNFMLGIAGLSGLGSLMPLRSGHAQMAAAGRVSRSAGAVVVVRGGGEMPVNTGAEIAATDAIRTGADSRAEITFSDGSVLTIGPDSEVVIAQFAPDEAEANAFLDLLSGIVRVTVNKATGWGKFDVRTSTAVASVRGTEYLVDSTDATSAVFVVEGRVAVSSRVGAGTVVIRAGQGVDVTAEYVPLVVKTWGAKRRDAALARVTFP